MSKEEKRSILSQLIHLAKIDEHLKQSEYNFMLAIANQIGLSKDELDELFKNPAPIINLHPESQRIVQFHRLILLMNVDQNISDLEIEHIHKIGLKMGLNIQAINKTLDTMHSYENNIIPPDVLLKIFKTYHN